MIEFFRRASGSIIARIFFGFLAISFAFMWGGQEGLRMMGISRDATVAKVGSEIISNRDLVLAIERFRVMLRVNAGQDISDKDIRSSGLDRQILDTLVSDSLVRQEATKLGIAVSDDYVVAQLKTQKSFLRPDGSFSKEAFIRFINNYGFGMEKDYIAFLKSDILKNRVARVLSLNASLPLVSEKPLFAWDKQVRFATAMLIDPKKAKFTTTPSEGDLREFYGKNQRQFLAPERRTFKAIIVSSKDMDVSISENDVKTIYDLERTKKYQGMKEDKAKILVRAQLRHDAVQELMLARANKIQESFEEGASLKNIASKSKAEFVDLLEVTLQDKKSERSTFDQVLIEMAFAAEEGDLSPLEEVVVPGDLPAKYAVIYVEDRKDPKQLSLSDAKHEVMEAYKAQEQQKNTFEMIQKIETSLRGGANFTVIAKQYALKTVSLRADRQKMLPPTPAFMLKMQPNRLFVVPHKGYALLQYVREGHGVVYALAQITDIKNGNAGKNPKEFKFFKDHLQAQSANDMFQLLTADLLSRYKVEINKKYFTN